LVGSDFNTFRLHPNSGAQHNAINKDYKLAPGRKARIYMMMIYSYSAPLFHFSLRRCINLGKFRAPLDVSDFDVRY